MGAYSTIDISRETAEDMVRKIRAKINPIDDVSRLSHDELDKELREYANSGKHDEICGFLLNYNIKNT
jgi:hypothetical protein